MRFHLIYYPCVLPKTLKWPIGESWCPGGTRFFIIVEKQNGALLGYHLRSSRSFENMLRTRPIGVVSKKLIGLLITDLKRLLCKVDDDFRVNWRKKKLRIDNLIVYLVFTKSIVSTESLKLVLVLINTIFGFRKKNLKYTEILEWNILIFTKYTCSIWMYFMHFNWWFHRY